jgi:transposase InsO family protein
LPTRRFAPELALGTPTSSWKRFEADLPNQCWQADVTHWRLADQSDVEILDIIDDHSRLAIASVARPVTTGPDVVDTVTAAFADWGTPAANSVSTKPATSRTQRLGFGRLWMSPAGSPQPAVSSRSSQPTKELALRPLAPTPAQQCVRIYRIPVPTFG